MSGKHAKPWAIEDWPPGKFRALILGTMWTLSTVLMAFTTPWLSLVFGTVAFLYYLSFFADFRGERV